MTPSFRARSGIHHSSSSDEVVAEQFSDEAKITNQRPDRSRREHAATARGNEALGS